MFQTSFFPHTSGNLYTWHINYSQLSTFKQVLNIQVASKIYKIKNNNNNCWEEDPKVTLGSSSHSPKRVINKWNTIKIWWQNGKMMEPPHDPLRQPCFGNTKYDQCVSVHWSLIRRAGTHPWHLLLYWHGRGRLKAGPEWAPVTPPDCKAFSQSRHLHQDSRLSRSKLRWKCLHSSGAS